ncbi:hypothetical protein EMIHUDRAFT_449121, partial [Emiliania huxleyi CCMP1516]|uniref:Uncharacterized protein n=2 Tax=Emiliania huxleyi TaxID=2903 RepID=A0A0D3KM67_EMIH1
MRGLGLRSLEEVAPAAFCACFVEAAERFLDRSTPGGGSERGFFQMLAPLFGHGAFELPYPNSPRLLRFLSGCTTYVNPLGAQLGQLTPTGESFKRAWEGMQREVRSEGVAGPLDLRAPEAGNGRAGSAGLQRQLTQQREQVKRNQLSRSILGLPHGDTRREAWLAVDSFSSAWVSSWPSAQNRCEAREFREIFCTYLGRESPAVRALVGKSIACSGRGPPRVCDAFGVQLGLATLNDRAHGNCHDDIFSRVIGDALHAGLRGKEEPREIFSAVIPPVTLNGTAGTRGKNGIAHPSVRWRGTTVQRGPEQPPAEHLLEGKTIHRGGPHYMSARARDDGQGGAEASDDLHQEARSYFATTLRRAWGVHFAREFARHRIRRVVFAGAPRRQPGRPLATADGDWPALSAGEFAAHALREEAVNSAPSAAFGRLLRNLLWTWSCVAMASISDTEPAGLSSISGLRPAGGGRSQQSDADVSDGSSAGSAAAADPSLVHQRRRSFFGRQRRKQKKEKKERLQRWLEADNADAEAFVAPLKKLKGGLKWFVIYITLFALLCMLLSLAWHAVNAHLLWKLTGLDHSWVSSMSEEALLGAVHKALGVDTAADGREGLIGRLDKLDTQIEQAPGGRTLSLQAVLVAYHAAQKGATGLVQVGRKLSENLAASSGSFGKDKKAPSFQVSKVVYELLATLRAADERDAAKQASGQAGGKPGAASGKRKAGGKAGGPIQRASSRLSHGGEAGSAEAGRRSARSGGPSHSRSSSLGSSLAGSAPSSLAASANGSPSASRVPSSASLSSWAQQQTREPPPEREQLFVRELTRRPLTPSGGPTVPNTALRTPPLCPRHSAVHLPHSCPPLCTDSPPHTLAPSVLRPDRTPPPPPPAAAPPPTHPPTHPPQARQGAQEVVRGGGGRGARLRRAVGRGARPG